MLQHRPAYLSYCKGKPVDLTNKGKNPLKVQILEAWIDAHDTTLYRLDKKSARKVYDRKGIIMLLPSSQHPRMNRDEEIEYGYIPFDYSEPFDEMVDSFRASVYNPFTGYRVHYWTPSEMLETAEHNKVLFISREPKESDYDDEWLESVLSDSSYEWI